MQHNLISDCLKTKGIPLAYAEFPNPTLHGFFVSIVVVWDNNLELKLFEEKHGGLVYIDRYELKIGGIENALIKAQKWISVIKENAEILKAMGAE